MAERARPGAEYSEPTYGSSWTRGLEFGEFMERVTGSAKASGLVQTLSDSLRQDLLLQLSMDGWPPLLGMEMTIGPEEDGTWGVVIPPEILNEVNLIEYGTESNDGKHTIHRFTVRHEDDLHHLAELVRMHDELGAL